MGRAQVITEARRVVGEGRPILPSTSMGSIPSTPSARGRGTGRVEHAGCASDAAGVAGLQLIGGDVCEVSPPLDPTGHTALNGANLMFEILCVVADAVVQRERERA